ncbi:MAG TPA: dTMP kinase [Candidatus Omnitrophota bacterium]|nr:dTMP kinase [Candidatus Omnitrophota bacterium]
MKGVFLTFEGSECCGKSTQAKLLYRYLLRKGCRVVFLREPGGTRISEMIRRILLDPANTAMSASTELLLYMASRAQTVRQVIKPALARGSIVLCDRFLDSTIVYQGYGLGMDLSFIRSLGRFATDGIKPDMTILLDLPLKTALGGIGAKKDRIERRAYAYHQKVRNGYLALARREPQRVKIVKVAPEKADTQAAIRREVTALLQKHRHRI